ncbi:HD-GYP domain-containing protein [Clostridium sp. JN-9]|uniref:HD-GYP domain-containing protein n=1 Tax=Clostridium sp. JN-9 TaxID=2507159 RepID=UPI000FFE0DB1|nr:HD-GYP domain-containing protein [Clostridium sp. JN-9]QAT41163.1 HD-GYP domain-containing protein [Clostridium sp. JN-9]
MRLEFINRVKENDILGKSILTNDGKILLRAGVKITNSYIRRLKNQGVFYIYLEDERFDDVEVEDEQLTHLKQETMKSMSKIVNNVHDFNGKAVKESLDNVEDLIEYIIEVGDVNKSLYDIKTYDNYTYVHSLDTCIMSTFLGISSGYGDQELKNLGIGAILHDVGKTKVPHRIISKQGKLTDDEFMEIKKHTLYGSEILRKNYRIPDPVIKIVEQHHERIDGKGYPFGLTANQISKFAKIVCVSDVYDAVSNDRCYRRKFSPNDAYELILAGSGSIFDEHVVDNFKNTFAIYPLGACVRLSNGEEGYVVRQNKGFPDRPIIRVIYDSITKKPRNIFEINLLQYSNIVIEKLV